jgi:hypothetical protein
MIVKPGTKLRSAVCDAQFVVVRAPGDDVDLACGGAPLLTGDDEIGGGRIDPTLATGSQLGKRYVDDEVGVELLCSKAGDGTLTCNGAPMGLKGAKPLPSSD